ncbi:hypothetical protein ACIQMJ_13355 [Actinosynnema sp. NPDC091369]
MLKAFGLFCVVVLVAWNYRDVGQVLSVWLSGRQTSGHAVGPVSMVWVGRIGKGMQFVAGCVVVLDLIGPDDLRAYGERVNVHLKDFLASDARARARNELKELRLQVRQQIIFHHVTANRWYGYSRWVLMKEADYPLGHEPWFTKDEVDNLRQEIVHALPTRHTCSWSHADDDLCDGQVVYVKAQVDRFVREGLQSRDRELLNHWVDEEVNEYGLSAQREVLLLLMGIFFSVIMAVVVFMFGSVAMTVIAGSPALLGIIAVLLRVDPLPLGLRLRKTIVPPLMRYVANILYQNRPGHGIRWFCFRLFLIGFSLDLLAS